MAERKLSDFGKLSDAEKQLVAACKDGIECVLGDGERPDAPSAERNIRARLLRFLILGGGEGCEVHEWGVQLKGAHIADQLDLSFAKARGPTGFFNCNFEYEIAAFQTRFDTLSFNGSACTGLNAQGAQVAGSLFLRNGFQAKGEVRLASAQIGGNLECSKGRFENKLGLSLNAQGACVSDSVFLDEGFYALGEVSLAGATIGGQLNCRSGTFENEDGVALNAENTEVQGHVLMKEGFKANGQVSFSGAKIVGLLECDNASFESGGDALNAQCVSVQNGLIWRNVKVKRGLVDFCSAKLGTLADDLDSWPSRKNGANIILDGMIYDRISGGFRDVRERLDWLSRGTIWNGQFHPQPYSQLAKVYREMGHNRAAREVLIRKEELLAHHQLRQDRERLGRLALGDQSERGDIGMLWIRMQSSRVWSAFLKLVVGYGYAPGRVLIWAVGIIVVSTLFYLIADQAGGMATVNERVANLNPFNPFFYAADVFIPFLAFGQEAQWTSDASTTIGGIARFATYLLSTAGWILSALGAAAVTGIIKRE